MLFHAPRRPCWEVVDHKEVKPMPAYYDQGDLQILKVHDSDIAGQYEFEMKTDFRCRQALEAARMELLHEIKKEHCNILLVEGWKLTKLRRGQEMRIRVHYHGMPILCSPLTALFMPHQDDPREQRGTCDTDILHSWRSSKSTDTESIELNKFEFMDSSRLVSLVLMYSPNTQYES
ncbi:hypothetical protein FRC10_006345 [Ceratobasidium sp. 414]|nr:hypothetical protein FRC10_006345 [Ceratobasidium sp. 414]